MKSKAKTEAAAGLNIPGSRIQHSTLGLILFAGAKIGDITLEKLFGMIKIDLLSEPMISI